MENRVAKLKLDDTKNEEAIEKESVEIVQECVRKTVILIEIISENSSLNANFLLLFQENNMTELNNVFAKIDDRRRVSEIGSLTNADWMKLICQDW